MKKKVVVVLLVFSIICLIFYLYFFKQSKYSIQDTEFFIKSAGNNIIKASNIGLVSDLPKVDIPVLYINLDGSTKRQKFIEDQFIKYSIKGIRVSGVRGTALKSLRKSSDGEEIQFENNFTSLTPSEVGCTLAHFKAIRTAYDNGYDVAMIIEDDCCFDLLPFWEMSISDVLKIAPPDWNIIQMYHLNSPSSQELFVKHENGNYYWSNTCYIINRRGMAEIFRKIGKEKFILDKNMVPRGEADAIIYDLTTTYTYTIPMVVAMNTTLSSEIHDDHTNFHLSKMALALEKYIDVYLDVVSIDEQQLKMATALCDMDDELSKHNIPYFLTCGTLLGVYREGKFIKGDPDIDLGCFSQNYRKLPKVMGNLILRREYGDLSYGYECSYLHVPTNIPIDIFLYYSENGKLWSATYNGLCDLSKKGMCRWQTEKFDLIPTKFLNREFMIPSNTEAFLETRYGVDWMIPKHYSYLEGLEKGYYKGLIKSDFDDSITKTWKTDSNRSRLNIYPVKLHKMGTLLWYYQTKYTTDEPELIYDKMEFIIDSDYVVSVISTIIDPNFVNIQPEKAKEAYIKACILTEYGGVWKWEKYWDMPMLKEILDSLNHYNAIVFEKADVIAGNPYNKVCVYLKYLFESEKYNQWMKKETKVSLSSINNDLSNYIKKLRKLYLFEV